MLPDARPVDAAPAPPIDAAPVVVAAPIDAAPAVAPATDCTVAFQSTPDGAEVTLSGEVLGQTPLTKVLPCGVSAKVAFRKSKYESTSKTIKPSPKGLTVKVKLERPSVQVMVSAKGAGLKAGSVTVLVNGKAVGTAPRKVPIPAWTTSKITFRADGYKDVTKSVTTQGEDAAPVNVTLTK
jgi:hypothetical protein